MNIRFVINLLLMISLICGIFLVKYANKRRSMPGARYFVLLLISAMIYDIGYIGEINSNSRVWAMFWFDFEHIAIPLQHYLWLMMCLEYAGIQKNYQQIIKYVALVHPVVYLCVYFTNKVHHLYISDFQFVSNGYFPVLLITKGYMYWVMIGSATLIGFVVLYVYGRAYLKSSRLHRYGYVIMTIATLPPWIAVYFTASDRNVLGIDYFPVVFIITGLLYALGIFMFSIFQIIPIATEMVFRHSKEGILLVDLGDRIIEANDTMMTLYPELTRLSTKLTFAAFVFNHCEFNGINSENTRAQYELKKDENVSHYTAELTKIVTEEGLQIGKIFTVKEVTLYVEQQKRLEMIATNALNKAETNEISFLQAQIKPHFLNNTLSVISSMISRNPDKAKELIADLGEYLVSSYFFDSNMDQVQLVEELETLYTYVAIEKARFGERFDFQIVSSNIPDIQIPRLILQPLVENAIRHGILKKAEGGTIFLSIEVLNNRTYFKVIDDGVGIPIEKIKDLYRDMNQLKGIALMNIHKRLQKYFGEGLIVKSEVGIGTEISFSIPLVVKGNFVEGVGIR